MPASGPETPISRSAVREGTRDWNPRPILVLDAQDKFDAFAASSAALTKSGTSTLELAMAGVPMVMTYRVNPLTAAIARRLFTVRYASLVNLLAQREIVPEFIQQACTPDRLATALGRVLTEPTEIARQRAGFRETLAMLRPPEGTPSEAAAIAVLKASPSLSGIPHQS